MKIKWEDWTPSGPDGITYRYGTCGDRRVSLRVGPSASDPSWWSAVVNINGGTAAKPTWLQRTQDGAKIAAVRLANRIVASVN